MKWRYVLLVSLVLALLVLPAFGAPPSQKTLKAEVSYPVAVASSPAFRDLPVDNTEVTVGNSSGRTIPNPQLSKTGTVSAPEAFGEDAVRQYKHGNAPAPAPLINFDGINNLASVAPPDTQGDIGPDHYMQWVNLHLAAWSINRTTWTPTLVLGPVAGNSIWATLGGQCASDNNGDPIVLWDRFRSRWVISQFSLGAGYGGPYKTAIAVSKTADPTGAWWLYCYDFHATTMNDYPKFGVWPDGYYYTCNQFTGGGSAWGGAAIMVFEADKMINGDLTARQLKVDLGAVNLNYGGILPAHFEGTTNPPAASPCYFLEVDDSAWIPPTDALRLWKGTVNWTTPSFTVGLAGEPNLVIPTSNWDFLCGGSRNCIAQPGTSQKLDSLGDRLMYRLQYRNFGTYESMVVNHSVDAGGGQAGIRWYELRKDGTHPDWYLYQEGTYAPTDGIRRWMGSVAQDHMGDLGVGFSMSDGTSTYPSVGYAGRLAGDPLGTLPQSEVILHAGAASQTGVNRWGDYSTMSIDPVDDCTFWYTQEYTTGGWNWATRIGAFKFGSCSIGPTGTLSGFVVDNSTLAPISGATVTAVGTATVSTTTGPTGAYTMTLPVDTYTVTASAFGYNPYTIAGIPIANGEAASSNFWLTAVGFHSITVTTYDGSTTWPLYSRIDMTGDMGYPGATFWTNPLTGTMGPLPFVDGVTYHGVVTPLYPGYGTSSFTTAPLSTNTTFSFGFGADASCTAPGYVLAGGITEAFSATTMPAGWTVVNNGGACEWSFNNPGGRGNLTGGAGNFAVADADACGSGTTMNTELRTPVLNFTGMATVPMTFKSDYNNFSSGESADVDVSINGAAGPWTNVWHRNVDARGPMTVTLDLSAIAGNQANVMVRFHYIAPGWDWWWEVDDVAIGTPSCTAPAAGGLIVGQVNDANTGGPVTGATVTNTTTTKVVTSQATPDPAVGDAFYCAFANTGNVLDAAKAGYGTDTTTAGAFPANRILTHDFALAAGRLMATPSSLTYGLPTNQTDSEILNLANVGTASLNWTVSEALGHLAPSGNLFACMTHPAGPTKIQWMEAKAKDKVKAREGLAQGVCTSSKPSPAFGNAMGTKRIVLDSSKGDVSGKKAVTAPPSNPWPPSGPIQLYVDDGTAEDSIGLTSGGQFVWFNRFTPNAVDFPFVLDQISVIFNTTVANGSNMELLVYSDPDGNPNNGATFLYSQNVTVLNNDFATWNDYTLTTPVLCAGPGDVLIGLVNRDGLADYPAAIDQTASQGRSWIGYYGGPAPDPPTFPASSLWGTIDSYGLAGNWMVRASGNPADVPWLDETPKLGTIAGGANMDVTVSYDATGLATGPYLATLNFNNDTPYGPLGVPVTLNVWEPVAAGAPLSGQAPVTVAFTGSISSPTGSYTYDWDFGDGSPHSGAQNPTHIYNVAGAFTVVFSATDSWGHTASDSHLVASITVGAIPVVYNFYDDQGRARLCVNRLTGAYAWTVSPGIPGTTYTGVATVSNGGTKIYSKPGDPYYLNVTYDAKKKRALGYFSAAGVYSTLSDYNTTNNPPGCY